MFKDFAFEFEDEVLLALCFLSYVLNMVMQKKDRNIQVTIFDWVANFASTLIWPVVAYYTSIKWLNIGFRMTLTIIITMLAPDITKMLIDRGFRKLVLKALGDNILRLITGVKNNEHE